MVLGQLQPEKERVRIFSAIPFPPEPKSPRTGRRFPDMTRLFPAGNLIATSQGTRGSMIAIEAFNLNQVVMITMRREFTTVLRYSLRSRREMWFRLTYEVREGPRPGIEKWFLVGMEELCEHTMVA